MNKRKIIITVLSTALIGFLGAGSYLLLNDKGNSSNTETIKDNSGVNVINLEPPTEEEQKAGNTQKEKIVEEQQVEKENQLPNEVSVVITDASQYNDEVEVRAFVNNIIEDGVCTVTFSLGQTKIDKEVPAKAQASSTTCLTLTVPRSEFSSTGEWSVLVKYKNQKIMGSTVGKITIK